MTATLEPYPDYKPSGVGWLGDVPAHWGVRRAKFFYREVDERSSTGSEELMPVSHKTGVTPRKQNVTMFIAESNVGYKVCRPGDIVINTMWAYMAALGVARQDGLVSPSYGVYRPLNQQNLHYDYIDFLLRTEAYRTAYLILSTGITASRLRLYPESFLGIPLLYCPLAEQIAIVNYLDYVDQRIHRYIDGKHRFIGLLEEQRRAVIHRAVTRGLDPNVRLKPSGIDWLGEVPAHWETRRLKTLCKMRSGDGITSDLIEPAGLYPVYGGNGLRGYTTNYTHDGSFVLIGRQGALCGNIHIARGRFWASEHAVVASLFSDHVIEWFAAILRVMNLNQYSISAAQPGLAVDRVLNLSLPVPPPQEQIWIACSTKRETADIDAAIDRTHREIELIREYRKRLIADVVTGKLDVREAAAKLAKDGKIEPASHRQTDDSANFETGMSGRFQLGDAKNLKQGR